MKVVHPRIRKFMTFLIKKLSFKVVKISIIVITLIMAFDCIISAHAINLFTIRMIAEHDLNVAHKDIIIEINDRISNNTSRMNFINTFFSNNKMVKTYPNLKVQQLDGSIVYFKDLLPDIKPYLFRFSEHDYKK